MFLIDIMLHFILYIERMIMAKILLFAKLTPQSGNTTTAERIQSYFLDCGHTCELRSTTSFQNVKDFRDYLSEEKIQCIIGIHLWRAGKFLLDCAVPFSLIFGGTDLNEHFKDINKFKIMSKVVKQAKILIAFSHTMAHKAKELWPDIKSKVTIQPQAVLTKPSEFSEKDLIGRMKEFSGPQDKLNLDSLAEGTLLLFLLVAGLRPVKDPMFLFKIISVWHREDPRVYLVVIGPEIDPDFSKQVNESAKQYPGVLVLPALTQCDLHAVIKDCSVALVNSSLSEGMASVILEAMDLGTVVLARRIPGNESLIKHDENGLLFDSPQEFLSLAKELIASNEQRSRVTLCGKRYTWDNHSTHTEKETYYSIIKKMI